MVTRSEVPFPEPSAERSIPLDLPCACDYHARGGAPWALQGHLVSPGTSSVCPAHANIYIYIQTSGRAERIGPPPVTGLRTGTKRVALCDVPLSPEGPSTAR